MMNKKLRKSVDVRVAFSSRLKHLVDSSLRRSANEQLFPATDNSSEAINSAWGKRLFKKIARYGYRFVKPVLRPIAFRAKRYFLQDLQQETLPALMEVITKQQEALMQMLNARLKLLEQNCHAAAYKAVTPCDSKEDCDSSMKAEVIIVGAGGHAKVCVELLRAMGERVAFSVGAIDNIEECLDVPVLQGDDNLAKLRAQGYSKLFVAIGSNQLRDRLATLGLSLGYKLVNAISPYAVISPTAKLGVGIAIMAGAVINAEVCIGDFAIINTGATIDHDCSIGQAVHLAPQCALAGNVVVGDYSFLGIGSKVIPKITIAENVNVGAGGVVISNLNAGALVKGVPAKSK